MIKEEEIMAGDNVVATIAMPMYQVWAMKDWHSIVPPGQGFATERIRGTKVSLSNGRAFIVQSGNTPSNLRCVQLGTGAKRSFFGKISDCVARSLTVVGLDTFQPTRQEKIKICEALQNESILWRVFRMILPTLGAPSLERERWMFGFPVQLFF
jgi:hypothetical protein